MDGLEQQLEAEAGVVYLEERRLARSPRMSYPAIAAT
jgi:hypothetical protein